MSLTIRDVASRRDLKTFIYLPEKIHRDHKNWVPPIYMDEWSYFNPKKNRAFSYSDAILLLAFRDGKPVGRVMGIINRRYNEARKVKVARFGYLEAWKEKEVIQALLEKVEDWACSKGMTKIIGPYGFTDQDPEGFLIQGFEYPPTIATYYNFEWMPEMVEALGYTKDVDYFVYKLDVPKEIPEFYKKIHERVKRKGNFEILEFQKK
ncbi:MAG: GNAT family N-acetyltransferase, partial [Candidatus Aminicenantales bacterium]